MPTIPVPRPARVSLPPFYKYPWKFFYLFYIFGSILFRIPYYLVKYSIPSNRPSPTWSLKCAVAVPIIRSWNYFAVKSGLFLAFAHDADKLPSDKELEAAGDECRAIWIPPVGAEGIPEQLKSWMDKHDVKPIRLPGFWWAEKGKHEAFERVAEPDEKVVVHFHGGAYILGGAHPASKTSVLPRGIFQHARRNSEFPLIRMLTVEYRLCRAEPITRAANPYPTQLLDGLSAIHYLVYRLHFHPRNIIVSGDSSGGNLSLGLTRILRDAPLLSAPPLVRSASELPTFKSLTPGGLLLQSPWSDVMSTDTPERLGPDCSMARNEMRDIVGRRDFAESWYGRVGLLGSHMTEEVAARSAILSPASLDLVTEGEDRVRFDGYPPTYITVGGYEIMYDEINILAERIARDSPEFLTNVLEKQSSTSTDITNGTDGTDGTAVGSGSSKPESNEPSAPEPKSTSGKKGGEGKRYKWVELACEPFMYHDWVTLELSPVERDRALTGMADWLAALPPASHYES